MPAPVRAVSAHVFPVPPLPEADFALADLAIAPPVLAADGAAEPRLQLAPADGEVGVVRRQPPDRVQMVGQHHHRVHAHRMLARGRGERRPERIDPLDQQSRPAVRQRDGEEVDRPGNGGSSAVRHGRDGAVPLNGG
jgi:hypothetical protein